MLFPVDGSGLLNVSRHPGAGNVSAVVTPVVADCRCWTNSFIICSSSSDVCSVSSWRWSCMYLGCPKVMRHKSYESESVESAACSSLHFSKKWSVTEPQRYFKAIARSMLQNLLSQNSLGSCASILPKYLLPFLLLLSHTRSAQCLPGRTTCSILYPDRVAKNSDRTRIDKSQARPEH